MSKSDWKRKNNIILIFAFALLAVFIIFMAIRLKNSGSEISESQKSDTAKTPFSQDASASLPPAEAGTDELEIYNNAELGFSFQYPKAWTLKDFISNPNQPGYYDVGVGYMTAEQNESRVLNYCEAYSGSDPERCQVYDNFVIDWQVGNAFINDASGGTVGLSLTKVDDAGKKKFEQIISSFQFSQ